MIPKSNIAKSLTLRTAQRTRHCYSWRLSNEHTLSNNIPFTFREPFTTTSLFHRRGPPGPEMAQLS